MQIPLRRTNFGRLIGLLVVTAFASAVMFAGGNDILVLLRVFPPPKEASAPIDPTQAAAPVVVQQVREETIDVTLTAAGRIQAFETYHPSFEIAGRIISLGDSGQGAGVQVDPLDEGDRVTKGQVLAVLDQAVLIARSQEALALKEQADDDLRRARELQSRSAGAISPAEFQRRITDVVVAKAAADIAAKNLKDSTLYAPATGVISKRNFQVGDSVSPHSVVFEILEDDKVLLVVGVPESQVEDLRARRRLVDEQRRQTIAARERGQSVPFEKEDVQFTAHVRLIGSDRYQNARADLQGVVYQVSERAELDTRQFLVEILLDNRQGVLRPGMIATADIVVGRVHGFRLPIASAQFRDGKTYLFSVKPVRGDVQFLGASVGMGPKHQARRFELSRYIEQGAELIIPAEALPEEHRLAIVRGQHRVVDGRLVRIVDVPADAPPEADTPAQPRTVFAPKVGAN